MTQDDIIRMASEANIAFQTVQAGIHMRSIVMTYGSLPIEKIEAFAKLVAAAEREACAQVCDQEQSQWNADRDGWQSAKDCAAAIRARGEKGNAS